MDSVPPGVRTARRASRFWASRPATLARLREALSGDVVLVRGPGGVGKSSILRQFAAALDDDEQLGVQLIDGASSDTGTAQRIVEAFATGPSAHVLLVDNHVEGSGLSTEQLLHLLRTDPDLRIVVATRHATGLESPLIALEFDVHVLPAEALLMTRDEVAEVLELNSVVTTDLAVDDLTARIHGWPALAQLAASRLRLEGLSLRTRGESAAVAEYAATALTTDFEHRLRIPVTDDIRLLAVAPYVTSEIADALGVDPSIGTTDELLARLQDAGLAWPSSTRLTLAEPVRERWLRDITARAPERVTDSRLHLLDHLVDAGEPLLAAQLAAAAHQWDTLATILRSSGPEIWARDAECLPALLDDLVSRAPSTPWAVDALLALDPRTAASPETPALAVAGLSQLPDARTPAGASVEALTLRVNLLRAAGRFALSTESAATLGDALRQARGLNAEAASEGWYQVGMTAFAMGKLRDARIALTQSERTAPPARRLRARGAIAVLELLEGDVAGARALVQADTDETWKSSPWGEGLRLAEAWLRLEEGDAAEARALLDDLPATAGARELWPYAASVHALSFLLSGAASDALGLLRVWNARTRSTPPSHFQSIHLLTARAKVLIALRQARKAMSLFEGPYALSAATAPAIALSNLYAGRTHESFVMSVKWGLHHEPSPRAALESLVVSIVADVRLNGASAHRTTAQRAEALSARHDLWSPWSAVAPEDRAMVLKMLSPETRERLTARRSFFASSVSVPHLTKREQVVLAQLTPTSTISDIARALVVSPNTVKTQLQGLYRKLEVSDRSSAIRAAHAWGLIENDSEM
ncbi:LuxR C-terminal-related transcriptional regulator [uncultured Microbacterium sp.]|uniref:helix-turn-helix transcriptional regulator n=1 Tax=uncultured Microbacterium sp. TaxID=191216 RepID=UPI0025D71521|nr:LuxR C-terminal-related transcriptional regulator [uncultured Microbacterium sp.]